MKNLTHNFDSKIKYQKYSYYLLPITIEPLKYGNLIEQIGNKYIIQMNTLNVLVINSVDNDNFIRFYNKGNFLFEFKDSKVTNEKFTRIIQDQKFTFEKGKLITTELLTPNSSIIIYSNSDVLLTDNNPLLKNDDYIPILSFLLKKIKDPVKAFLLWEFCLILFFYIIFGILPDLFINNELEIITLSTVNIIKLRKTKSRNVWKELTINFGRKVFTTSLFKNKFNKFWKDILSEFNENNHLFIILKIKYVNNDFVTIGKLQRLNFSDKDWYIDFIIENIKFKSEYYNETQIEEIIFSYGFKKGTIPNKNNLNQDVKSVIINNINLPISLNPIDFGILSKTIDIENGQLFILQNNKGETVMFSKFNNYNEIEYLKNGISLIRFKDEIISENKFVRIIDNKKYYFENNQQILFTKEMKTKFISKTVKTKNLNNNFITLDIETYVNNGNILVPFCISIYDGKNVTSFYLTDYKNVDDMVLSALRSIMIRKYNGYNVYMHNMAKFDIIFLFKYLLKLGLVHPIIHNERIILIGFNFGPDNKYQIKFKDSLLLLLNSLDKLSKSFKVENPKSLFPHFFVNENNLDYIGEVPDHKYFKNVNLKKYSEYKSKFNNNWNLKKECIKYCNLDCISLYQILFKFNDLIFSNFGKNIHHYPTLPGLAINIFKSNFMKEENIPKLSGKIANDIRTGYTGGAVDMYIPKSKPEVKIKCYDVNSLYPSQMQSQLMPIGSPTYFEGNILKINPNAFGFFYCKIKTPDNILHPILQTHVKTDNGMRTISPIGTWEDMLFSAEINNAIKYGYEFEVLWGYTFNSDIIFKDYVDFLYILRSQYDKSNPMNFIAKILMNSLYGRFGMDDNFSEINVIHKDYFPDFENKLFDNIIKTTEIDNYFLVEFENISKEEDNLSNDVSIAIAASVTAYSRIHMSQFKNNPKINLYYTDTDSIYVDEDSEIDINLINNKILGKLKLENICNKAIFLSPKVYCLETVNGETIYKVKGLKHEVELSFNFINCLLNSLYF
jgi:DNA polymerase type B, organellar and viral